MVSPFRVDPGRCPRLPTHRCAFASAALLAFGALVLPAQDESGAPGPGTSAGLAPAGADGGGTAPAGPERRGPTAGDAERSDDEMRRDGAEARAVVPRGTNDDYRPRNRKPRLIKTVPPQYPEQFKGTGLTAEVMVSMMVDRLGRASHIRVEDSPDPAFTDAALEAIGNWEFLPAIKETKVTNFRIENIAVLVSEELGENTYFDYLGGRIALEKVTYSAEPDQPLKRLRGLRAPYPFEMLAEGKPGEVVVEFVVGEEGVAQNFQVIESTHRDFSLAAQAAVGHWLYSPAMTLGITVPATLRYRVSFQPEDFDESARAMAKDLLAGRSAGLVSARQVERQPSVAYQIQPVRPIGAALSAGRQRVTVGIVVTEQGEVRFPHVVAADDPLAGYVALAAVSYWRFRPALRENTPVPVRVVLPLVF